MEAVKNHGAIFTEIQSRVTVSMDAEPHDANTSSNQVLWKIVAKKYVAESARWVGEKVSEHSRGPLIIIYFDESHTLFKRPLQYNASRYQALCLALDYLSYPSYLLTIFVDQFQSFPI